jgi:transposase
MTRATRTEWAGRVRRWRASGLTAREFAAREQLNPNTLNWWSSQLRRTNPAPGGFVELTVTPMPVAVEAGCIEVVVRDEVRIRVSGAFDPAVLRRVLSALEGR